MDAEKGKQFIVTIQFDYITLTKAENEFIFVVYVY